MFNLLKTVFAFALIFAIAATASAGTARLQVIHNAADPAAATVDIYVNGDLLLPDFAFRAATPFIDVPAGVELNVGVAPGNSSSADDALATFPLTLESGRRYIAMATGVLDPSAFAGNPDGESIGFTIVANSSAREQAHWRWFTDIAAFHGATDAPEVDIRVRDWHWGALFGDLQYAEFSSYRTVYPKKYTLDVTPANDKNTVVASFEADLSGLRGGAAVVFASGFLNPTGNQDGEPFGLFAALPDGQVIELPSLTSMARLQVIHNAADPDAAMVDVYVNGERLLDDFAFRAATPFIDVPAGVNLSVGIAPATSTSADDIIATFDYTLADDETYVLMATGVLGGGFAENPDGLDIGFTLVAKDNVREKARWGWFNNILAFHGATDAPAVDIVMEGRRWSRTLFSNLEYGQFSGYNYLASAKYTLNVTPAGDRNTIVAQFEADLSSLKGAAAVVFASGFLSPDDNNNGEGFGLFAALPNGTVVEFPQIMQEQFARLQVIHNAADPAAEVVDIYVNGGLLIPDFAFRAATPFVTVPAGVELNIAVAPGNSVSVADALATFPVTLAANKKYIAVANGVVATGFAANPDGRDIGFTLWATDNGREAGKNGSDMVDLLAVHGATDAPTVDVVARGVDILIDDAAYGDFQGYISVPAGSYTLDVTPGDDNSTVVASYVADLSGLGGGAAVVFASGFLDPSTNNDGPAFGLYAALPDGTVIGLPTADARQTAAFKSGLLPDEYSLEANYPNPFNPTTTIRFSLPQASDVNLRVFNLLGQEVRTLANGQMAAGVQEVEFDASALASGVYFYRLEAGSFSDTRKMMLVK
ncbi:MAG: DUF4397 domain-containing protein [candidate division Zixibacteria bacterium]|nr:DUF4397 domain-containing protein [candidate division Zixibacteria bacterium]